MEGTLDLSFPLNFLHERAGLPLPGIARIGRTLLALAEAVPSQPVAPFFDLSRNPLRDAALFDADSYPADLFVPPGTVQSNRAAFGRWGSYVNSVCREKYGRPLFLACAADLAESTNVADFGKDFGEKRNFGWYDRDYPGYSP